MAMARVLVVDDDRTIRELLRFALECEGYDVKVFRDGVEILTHLETEPDPCVILMDLMMPHIDGWEVCRRLSADSRLLGRHMLVLMTASLAAGKRLPTPARAILSKPFNLEQLYTLVAMLALPTIASPQSIVSLPEDTLLAS
jgi:two-component system, OmpR family, response regulator MprA